MTTRRERTVGMKYRGIYKLRRMARTVLIYCRSLFIAVLSVEADLFGVVLAALVLTRRNEEAFGSPFWAGVKAALFGAPDDDIVTGAPVYDGCYVFSDSPDGGLVNRQSALLDTIESSTADLVMAVLPVGKVAAVPKAISLAGKGNGSHITKVLFGGNAARFARSANLLFAHRAAMQFAQSEFVQLKAIIAKAASTFLAPDAAKRGAMVLNAYSLGVEGPWSSKLLRTLREARITLDRAAIAKKQAAGQPLTRAERSFFNHTVTAMPEYEARSVEQAVTKYADARKALASNAETIRTGGVRTMPGERLSGTATDAATAAAAKKAEAARPGLEAAMNDAEKAMLARLDSAQLAAHRIDRGLMALGELSRRLAHATPGSAASAAGVGLWRASGGLVASTAKKGYSVGDRIAGALVSNLPVITIPAGVVGGAVGAALGAVPAVGVAGVGYGAYKRATRPAPQPKPEPVSAAAPAPKPFDPYADPDRAQPPKPEEYTPEQLEQLRRRKFRRALERKYGKL